MATKTPEDYVILLSEYNTIQQRLKSKDEALKILKVEMCTLQECNNSLKTEVAQLKSQLSQRFLTPVGDVALKEREQFVSQLEECHEKISGLERLVQSLEDEKDDLLTEKSFFFEKCNTLEKCLEEKTTKAPPPSESLLEAVMEENRQLKLKILAVQAEREQALNRIERYKRAHARQSVKEASQLQVVRFSKHHESQKVLQRIGELETLANSLSESVKEKTIALTHQKKANKMLAGRIAELENRLKTLELSGLGEVQQQWSGEEEEEEPQDAGERLEQQRTESSTSGATKIAVDPASRVEVA